MHFKNPHYFYFLVPFWSLRDPNRRQVNGGETDAVRCGHFRISELLFTLVNIEIFL